MAELNFGKTVTLAQASNIILSTPMNRYFLRGETGIGKSSLLKSLSANLPDHEVSYIDVPNMDLGDIAMPVIDRETKTTAYYPNSRFKIHLGKPVITMLDEYTKGADPIKNMLHPMLEVANPRLGDISLHPDSITFLTGNLSSDGVGDSLKAHSMNRIIPLHVSKPDADQWMAFVSPRSLERVSNIVRVRSKLDSDSLICAMSGAVGESASRDMQAYIEFSDQLPTWESVIANPKTAHVPESAGACAIIVFGAIAKVDKQTMPKFMEYIERFQAEWQACFAINIAKSPTKQQIAFSSSKFADWVQKNEDLL